MTHLKEWFETLSHSERFEKIKNYLEFIGENEKIRDLDYLMFDMDNLPVSVEIETIKTILEIDLKDLEDYIGCTTI